MKWSDEKVKQLKMLANIGTSNKEIAQKLEISITDVYAKRSQLGITIDKVKGIVPNPLPNTELVRVAYLKDRKREFLYNIKTHGHINKDDYAEIKALLDKKIPDDWK